jgi:hypothetical protein
MALQVILSLLVAIFFQITVVKADECVTVESFVSAFASEGISLRGSTAAATEKMAKVFNENREANGQPKTSISIFLLGYVSRGDGEPGAVVAIADKNGCIIQRSVTVLGLRTFFDFITKAGVTGKDFIPIDGA